MLVLTRKLNEGVVVTHDATGVVLVVKVLEIRSGQIKLGFGDDPHEFTIHRDEVARKIARQRREADEVAYSDIEQGEGEDGDDGADDRVA